MSVRLDHSDHSSNTRRLSGEPPYSVGQASANDLNANTKYPTLDGRIESTYAANSTATNKNSLYDSYIRAFRWATDRIGDAGVVAFVSNGGWIDGNTADGIRLSLVEDYRHIYVYNLRGNQRTAGELSRKEGGKIFGSGSRNTVAVFIGIKDPHHTGPCLIHYNDIGDCLTREQKLQIVADNTIETLEWKAITPSPDGDWVNQRDETFSTWPVIGDKDKSSASTRIFSSYSSGLKTGRDAWCYSYSRTGMATNMRDMIAQYDEARIQFVEYCNRSSLAKSSEDTVADYLASHPELTGTGRISWNRGLKQDLAKDYPISWSDDAVRLFTYRPFCDQWGYLDRHLNDMVYQLAAISPTPHHANIGYYQVGNGSAVPFSVLMLKHLPDLHVTGAGSGGQFFPRWTYQRADDDGTLDFSGGADVDEWGYRRVDNITDEVLALYRAAVGDQVDKDGIFYYVYGLLHDPGYRFRYAADLKKMLPHIPTPETLERFLLVADVGRQLADLHVGYEEVESYPLDVQLRPGASASSRETWRVEKMKWKSKTDRSAIIYNAAVTVAGIPDAAHGYLLGSRTALEWLIDRYQVKTDKASGIVNDPNDWCDEHDDPTYIVELIKKVTTVSVRTVELVARLSDSPGAR